MYPRTCFSRDGKVQSIDFKRHKEGEKGERGRKKEIIYLELTMLKYFVLSIKFSTTV